MSRLYPIVCVLICIVACKPKTPSQYIQEDELVDILVDYHQSRAMGQMNGSYDEQTYNRALYWSAVLEKYDITQEQFDSSLTYYYGRADKFVHIYRKVYDRLEEQNTLLGASEGEIGKFAALQADGDTANIWPGRTSHLMMPMPPYDRFEFVIEGDTTFYEGDTFLMQFMADFTYQSGVKDGMLYLAVDYSDTTIVRQNRFTYTGLCQIQVDYPKVGLPQRIKGFFYLSGAHDRSTTLRLLFIDNIQLIRFHKKYEKPAPGKTDSLSRDSVTERPINENVNIRDTVESRSKVLSVTGGTSPN